MHTVGARDESNPGFNTPGFYAIWPSRGTHDKPAAPRRRPGTVFTLSLRCPKSRRAEVEGRPPRVDPLRRLRGAHTTRLRRRRRRRTTEDAPRLPSAADARRLTARRSAAWCRQRAPKGATTETPSLSGAQLVIGAPSTAPPPPGTLALSWLKDFRQGAPPAVADPGLTRDPGLRARAGRPASGRGALRGPKPTRSVSSQDSRRTSSGRTPRSTTGRRCSLARASGSRSWGSFQTRDRSNNPLNRVPPLEPGVRDPVDAPAGTGRRGHRPPREPAHREGLLPLADGRFVPCALWLRRALSRRARS